MICEYRTIPWPSTTAITKWSGESSEERWSGGGSERLRCETNWRSCPLEPATRPETPAQPDFAGSLRASALDRHAQSNVPQQLFDRRRTARSNLRRKGRNYSHPEGDHNECAHRHKPSAIGEGNMAQRWLAAHERNPAENRRKKTRTDRPLQSGRSLDDSRARPSRENTPAGPSGQADEIRNTMNFPDAHVILSGGRKNPWFWRSSARSCATRPRCARRSLR